MGDHPIICGYGLGQEDFDRLIEGEHRHAR
jgi:hypothetical protein